MHLFKLIVLFICCSLLSIKNVHSNNKLVDSLNVVLNGLDENEQKVKTSIELALVYRYINLDSSILLAENALRISKKLEQPDLIGQSFYHLGKHHGSNGDLFTTNMFMDSAALSFEKAANDSSVIEAKIIKVRALGMLGESQKSVDLAVDLLLKVDSAGYNHFMPTLLNLIAIGHQDLENNEKAFDYFELALESAIEEGEKQVEMWAYNNISSYYRHKKDFKAAQTYMKRALNLAIEINDDQQVARSYSNIGATMTKSGILDSAEIYLKKGYELFTKGHHNFDLVSNTWHLGELYLTMELPNKARIYLKESLELARHFEMKDNICYAFELLYRTERMSGNFILANQLADSLFRCKEDFYNDNMASQITASTNQYDKLLLEKKAVEQKAAIEKLVVKNKNNVRLAGLIGFVALLFSLMSLFYLKNKRAKEKLTLEEKYQGELTNKLEEDRKWRAAELHDNIGQQLVLMKQMIDKKGSLEDGKEMLQDTINQVRTISKDEYPFQLKYLGLKTTIEELIDRIENSSSIIVSEGLENMPDLSIDSNLHLFRIIQECFNNTLKYSGAPSVKIEMRQHENFLVMEYQDSGNGFDFKDKLETSKSLGLKTIIDRVRILKGKVKTLPSKGNGNKYIFHIPLHDATY